MIFLSLFTNCDANYAINNMPDGLFNGTTFLMNDLVEQPLCRA